MVFHEEAADVVGGFSRRELVYDLMGKRRVAGEFAQDLIDVLLADPCQSAVGARHRGERVDDHLQVGSDGAGVGVGQQASRGISKHAALASPAAVEFGFGAAGNAVDVERDAAAWPACGSAVDDAGKHALVAACADSDRSF